MRKLQSVQCLRGVAALLVVFHHARNPQVWLYNPMEHFRLGQIGVDIFFVISGFIMYSLGRHESASEFMRRRAGRIVPLYWVATATLLAVSINWHFEKIFAVNLEHIAASLLFIPHYSPEEPGRIWPYLIPGWTLNYEVFFYLVFTLGIVARRPFVLTSVFLGAAVLCGMLVDSHLATWTSYTDPIILEFFLGMLIAVTLRRPPQWLPVGLLCLGAAGLAAAESTGMKTIRLIAWGLPSACLVAAFIAYDLRKPIPKLPVLSALGDASYSIYLFQVVALRIVSRLFAHAPIGGIVQFIAVILTSIVLASALGCLAYRYIERPLLRCFVPRGLGRSTVSIQPIGSVARDSAEAELTGSRSA